MSVYPSLHLRRINTLRAQLEELERSYKNACNEVREIITGSEEVFRTNLGLTVEKERSEYLLPAKGMTLRYASDGILFFTVKGTLMSPEDSYAYEASGCKSYDEFFDDEKIEEFTVRRRINVTFDTKTMESYSLDKEDKIFFEKCITPGYDEYDEDEDFIYITEDRVPDNLVFIGGRMASFEATDGEKLFFDGRTVYTIKLIQPQFAVCDIIQVFNVETKETKSYFVRRGVLVDVSQIVVVNSITYYVVDNQLIEANSTGVVAVDVLPDMMVSDGKSLYYRGGKYVHRLTITYT